MGFCDVLSQALRIVRVARNAEPAEQMELWVFSMRMLRYLRIPIMFQKRSTGGVVNEHACRKEGARAPKFPISSKERLVIGTSDL